ncbi:23S rRNA (pseudouridine(1915)-N(3))-methyltransferase RlmH [Hydrogenoanaerobacterium sp.]|uniref:23S rRNA (pseudouridine(1915)-N(3))-methyltransferase RlmH n=1 Tax=Hydrogenoanaerobacterium sp. TaxID=2953763 RepID=UPI00289FB3B2|nr:23S rRNA (pseudouridine(1915)-N(3))-methyltransferase RlmH [Hydrogenoanaerobacterium sp.]
MLSITVICVGKLKESYLREGCAEYVKRLQAFCKISVIEVDEERLSDNPSAAQIDACIESEGKRIAAKLPAGAYLIPMCIEGNQLCSVELSRTIDKIGISGKSSIVFLIGGSHGLWEELKAKSQLRLSMSKMTFPHQLARMMLLEQIYRAFQISANGKYHK